MALHLITGHKGSAHITSADQGAYNMATFGDGNIVFKRGRQFEATTKSNNAVNIADGEAMIQGRFIKMPIGTTEDVTITNGTQGKYRSDLICIRYESVSGIESAKLVVIKGAENNSNPAPDPSYNTGSITDGTATVTDFPLYRVRLNGISLGTPEKLFTAKDSMADYMAHYQMTPAKKDKLGAIKIGNGLQADDSGLMSLNLGAGLKIIEGQLYPDLDEEELTIKNGKITSRYTYGQMTFVAKESVAVAPNSVAEIKLIPYKNVKLYIKDINVEYTNLSPLLVCGIYPYATRGGLIVADKDTILGLKVYNPSNSAKNITAGTGFYLRGNSVEVAQ